VITCYTCHQGRPVPLNTPVLPNTEFPLEEKATKQLPAPAEILAKYINALGGEQKLRAVTSRVVTATQNIPNGPGGVNPVPATTERYQKAPNLMLNVYHAAKFTSSNGFDGKRAWAQGGNGRVTEPPSLEQIRTARAAEILEPLQLGATYTRMTVEGIEKINGREAYLLVGYPKEIFRSVCTSTRKRACCCERQRRFQRRLETAHTRWITTTIATPAAA